jgi:hypothetical protein
MHRQTQLWNEARKADASGDADACIEALGEARHLYGLD